MQVYHNNILPPEIAKTTNEQVVRQNSLRTPNTAGNFQQVLNRSLDTNPLQFSKHAALRLSSREINLSDEQMTRVENGIKTAGDKGIRDSLIVIDNVALVVNIRNKTVITALDKNQTDSVFTNIDGAVIV